MHLGDKRGFVCDCCGKHMTIVQKNEIGFKKYFYDENYKVCKTTTTSSVVAYDFCDECFLKVAKSLHKKNNIRPYYNPRLVLFGKVNSKNKEMKILKGIKKQLPQAFKEVM